MVTIEAFLDYYEKAKKMQAYKYEGMQYSEHDINDDLIWNVPIYDVVNRKYAAFSSLLEALFQKEGDPKGNGLYFLKNNVLSEDFMYMCYLFRLCGSGINYVPKKTEPWGSHGFGNFWVVDLLRTGNDSPRDWLLNIPTNRFCDVKGYLLPMIKGGLRPFIVKESKLLFNYIKSFLNSNSLVSIKEVVDHGNNWLVKNGYMKQNFVLTAFAMDLAEYFPFKVDSNSDVYIGTNAKKCLKLILPDMKQEKALRYLCDITGNYSKPYDMEDVACDFIRYLNNFQSKEHILMNNNIIYRNNVCK